MMKFLTMLFFYLFGEVEIILTDSFIHSGDLYSAFSRDYYSEALPAQSRTKRKDDLTFTVVAIVVTLISFIMTSFTPASCFKV